ncbi:hypothetical protein Rs2_22438 [Raphanus sativus]|uniref:Uncharacterized protein LOC108859514 n=1 Tax=Raphanus sativus TaxID=3726 RepID=A0A6J0NX49_RAPSA|nr:uncharacterized protein LOC108859514 [Raphanus sativus]KAJ4895644.1 hypothetical protein Rs2_22438 [Raphanus sativus]
MAYSLLTSFAPATVRVYATTAKGASGGAKEEKNPLDFVLGYLTKQDQFYETDPILKKVEGTTGGGRGTVRGGGKSSAPVPVAPKKNDGGGGLGGLAGLFNKK